MFKLNSSINFLFFSESTVINITQKFNNIADTIPKIVITVSFIFILIPNPNIKETPIAIGNIKNKNIS